jgi:hypothetical protein
MTVVSAIPLKGEGMQLKKAISPTSEQAQLKLLKELASILSILHPLLVDYGPPWYTSN